MELIVALTLLGSLLVLISAAASTGTQSLGRIGVKIRHNIEIAQIDSIVRGYLGRIDLPYWLAQPKVQEEPGKLGIAYLDGEPDSSVQLGFHEGTLAIGGGGQEAVFGGLENATMEIKQPSDGTAVALFLTLQFAGEEPVSVIGSFGGYVFPIVAQ